MPHLAMLALSPQARGLMVREMKAWFDGSPEHITPVCDIMLSIFLRSNTVTEVWAHSAIESVYSAEFNQSNTVIMI